MSMVVNVLVWQRQKRLIALKRLAQDAGILILLCRNP